MPVENLSDFDHQRWCQDVLNSDGVEMIPLVGRRPVDASIRKFLSNNLIAHTLWTDRAIRAYIAFRRKSMDGAVTYPNEYCLLLSLGDGVDGVVGRVHGGFIALIIDQITGMCTEGIISNGIPPATARLVINYLAPIKAPSIVLARALISKVEGHKMTVQAVIEDGQGEIFANGEALLILAKPKI